MRVAIMQPYFLPYIGYFQLISAVDEFVVYDNIKYTKKGWINRNRFLQNGTDALFSLPLKKDSDTLDVIDRELSADFNPNKLLAQFRGAYASAPHFAGTFELLLRIVQHKDDNLFRFIHHSIVQVCDHLGLDTKIGISSQIDIDHELKSQDKVIAICKALGARTYINASGGQDLYQVEAFAKHGVGLKFIRSLAPEYRQFSNPFVPWLSIVDVLMFNPLETVRGSILASHELS